MVMPLCGTFRYAGVIPADGLRSGRWTLQDASGAGATARGAARFDNRLVGLQPALEISNGQLVLTASGRDRAQVSSASWHVDPALIDVFRTGDVLHLVRTDTADLGVAVVRARQLILAVGAAAVVPMAGSISVQEGPERGSSAVKPDKRPRKDTWVDVSVSGEALRLRAGETTSIGHYSISVLRACRDGIPGAHECLAISLNGTCAHATAVSSAERLIAPGLVMTAWPA